MNLVDEEVVLLQLLHANVSLKKLSDLIVNRGPEARLEEVVRRSQSQLAEGLGLKLEKAMAVLQHREDAENQHQELAARGVTILMHGRVGYPEKLLPTKEQHPYLFAKGNRDLLSRSSIAIVGARPKKPPEIQLTEAALSAARAYAKSLAGLGLLILSGGATGIDQEAHHAALEVPKGATAFCVSHGILAKKLQKRFAAALNDQNHLEISRNGPNCQGRWPPHFKANDTLIASLADAVLIVFARGEYTAGVEAERLGKPVFVVTFEDDEMPPGNIAHLERGAIPVSSRPDKVDFETVLGEMGLATER